MGFQWLPRRGEKVGLAGLAGAEAGRMVTMVAVRPGMPVMAMLAVPPETVKFELACRVGAAVRSLPLEVTRSMRALMLEPKAAGRLLSVRVTLPLVPPPPNKTRATGSAAS